MKLTIIILALFVLWGCETTNSSRGNGDNTDTQISNTQQSSNVATSTPVKKNDTTTNANIESPTTVEANTPTSPEIKHVELSSKNPLAENNETSEPSVEKEPDVNTPVIPEPEVRKPVVREPAITDNSTKIKQEADNIRKMSRSLAGNIHPTTVIENFESKKHLSFLVRNDVKDDRGYNMLMLACEFGFSYLVQDILKENATSAFINHQSSDGGKTALMIAADQGLADVVELLMVNGADAKIQRDNGKSAIDFAQYRYQNSVGTEKQNYKRILDNLQGLQGY